MLRLLNTLSGKKEAFSPLETGKVKMYNCGPTVYDYAHIGNFNAFLVADTLRRYLEFKGYEVRQIMNITDVGHLTADDVNQADTGQDKMLKAAIRDKKTPQQIAEYYTEAFFEDAEKLNLKKANYYPKATAHIPHIIKMIQILIEKGLAYEKNGNVFYDVEKFADYGKLSKKKIDELKHGARLEDHPDKKHSYDFALWLKAPKEHILKWESPWSLGYPGWHIECSAMSMEYLGETLDIHTGGEDHVFPHHENEIAQSEGTTGKPFSRFWLHNRFLLVNGAKMSKSKGNFLTLRDILAKKYSPLAFRLLIFSSHYRSNLNFTWDSLDQATSNLNKITNWHQTLTEISKKEIEKETSNNFSSFLRKFEEAMDDDLNTPLALSIVLEMVTETNKKIASGELSSENAKNILKIWDRINSVMGLVLATTEEIPANIKTLADQRLEAKNNKDFATADAIRNEISAKGYIIEDTQEGQKIKKK